MTDIKWIKLSVNMFDDEKIKLIRTMPEGDSIVVIWVQILCLAGRINDHGAVYMGQNLAYSDEMLATILNHPLNTIRIALQTLEQFAMISVNEEGEIDILNWEKHQSTDKMARIKEQNRLRKRKYDLRSKVRQLGYNPDDTSVPDDVAQLEEYVNKLEEGNVSVTLRNDTEVRSKKLEERSKKKEVNNNKPISRKSKKRTYEADSEYYLLAEFLFEKIEENNPEAKAPNLQNWADDIRKTVEIDKRTPDQLRNMVDWCQKHEFWSGVVLSPKSLRSKYDQMRVQANNEYKQSKNPKGRGVRKSETLPGWATDADKPVNDEVVSEEHQKETDDRLERLRKMREEVQND